MNTKITMSVSIPLSTFSSFDMKKRKRIADECTVISEISRDKIECFTIANGRVYLPKAYSESIGIDGEEQKYSALSTTQTDFKLREYQIEVEKEMDGVFEHYKSILLSLFCGWGKSYYAILYSMKLGLRTMVAVFRNTLIDQWKESILAVNPNLRVQVLENKTQKEEADFYIILGENLANRPLDEFSDVGVFVCDEAHTFCSPSVSKSLLRLQPKYCISLTATPFRQDKLDRVLQLHFGDAMITRRMYRNYNVYKLKTKYKPVVQMTPMGKMDWNAVMDSQCGNADRNELIVRLCQFFANRNILILSKRVELQGKYLYKRLQEVGESVGLFMGSMKKYNKDARILVATGSKAGTGFDHPKMDMLILASDTESLYDQYLGRVMRRQDTTPIIVDIVDNFSVFNSHFSTRMLSYAKTGGEVKDFYKHFPEFA
jgi:superfamily II DNA or RNA helicase